MQVAEHPSLGHLKEALSDLARKDEDIIPTTRQDNCPTPIFIRGIKRRCFVATASGVSHCQKRRNERLSTRKENL